MNAAFARFGADTFHHQTVLSHPRVSKATLNLIGRDGTQDSGGSALEERSTNKHAVKSDS